MKKYFPPGYNYKLEIKWLLALYALGTITSLRCFYKILDQKAFLYYKGTYIKGKMMPNFVDLADGWAIGFFLAIIFAVSSIFAHYLYHYQGTKSIYTMKRLKKAGELHFRCFSFPIFAILLSILLALVLVLVYYGFYLSISPPGSIPKGQGVSLKEALKMPAFYY